MDLTKTERTVLAYIGSGYSPKEIAAKLFRSYHTIAYHSKTMQLKNNWKNISEGVRDFTLEYGDPRKFITLLLLAIQIGVIYSDYKIRRKRVRKTEASKQIKSKRSKTREYYL